MVELAPSLAETLTEQTELLTWLLKRVAVSFSSYCAREKLGGAVKQSLIPAVMSALLTP